MCQDGGPSLTVTGVLPATEAKVESKDDDSDSEQQTRGAESSPAVASQPQRIALFPGVDPSALKVTDHQMCLTLWIIYCLLGLELTINLI